MEARKAKDARSAAKPTSRSAGSAAKPASSRSLPRNRSAGSAAKPTSERERSLRRNQTQASRTACAERLRAKSDAHSNYEYCQARLQSVFEDMHCIWSEVIDSVDTPATQRISWMSCWRQLECMVKAIASDVVAHRIEAMSSKSRKKLANVVGALKAMLAYYYLHAVLKNSAVSCWSVSRSSPKKLRTCPSGMVFLMCSSAMNSVALSITSRKRL